MVILGYFYREAHEAASIDAAWRNATEALGGQTCSTKSIGTAAIKPVAKHTTQPTPSLARPAASSSSYFASLTRQASNLASTVGLNGLPDISFGATSDGSLFEFSESQRQKARFILNNAAAAAAATDAATASSSSSSSAVIMRNSGAASTTPSERSSSSTKSSPELMARGRSSSVWSSAGSVTSVTQRNRMAARGESIW